MREVVLDTETTGLDPAFGHRIVEIGAVELLNHVATGRVFHTYLDPQRDMPADAFAVHGLSAAFPPASRCSPTSPMRSCVFSRIRRSSSTTPPSTSAF